MEGANESTELIIYFYLCILCSVLARSIRYVAFLLA